jgi:hypothetical protein
MESQAWKNTSTINIFYLILLQIKVNVVNEKFGQVQQKKRIKGRQFLLPQSLIFSNPNLYKPNDLVQQ